MTILFWIAATWTILINSASGTSLEKCNVLDKLSYFPLPNLLECDKQIGEFHVIGRSSLLKDVKLETIEIREVSEKTFGITVRVYTTPQQCYYLIKNNFHYDVEDNMLQGAVAENKTQVTNIFLLGIGRDAGQLIYIQRKELGMENKTQSVMAYIIRDPSRAFDIAHMAPIIQGLCNVTDPATFLKKMPTDMKPKSTECVALPPEYGF